MLHLLRNLGFLFSRSPEQKLIDNLITAYLVDEAGSIADMQIHISKLGYQVDVEEVSSSLSYLIQKKRVMSSVIIINGQVDIIYSLSNKGVSLIKKDLDRLIR